ncbi:mitochondrial carrier, partial [Lichtheimia hyalospora FSU 10163]
MSMKDSSTSFQEQPPPNRLRPYYTPGLHHQHNYTSLPSNDTIPGHTPQVFDNEESHLKNTTIAKFTSFAAFKYFMTMLTSPFEVGTTLLQVQYAPHESVEVIAFRESKHEDVTMSHHDLSSTSSSDEGDGFFGSRPHNTTNRSTLKSRFSNDPIATSVYDDKHRPAHQMAPMDGGVLDILSRIVRQPTEGWKSLFKGQRVTWIHEILWGLLQPGLQSMLNDVFGLYDDTIPLSHLDRIAPNIITLVASHIVVGVLLSPLEIIRTRLVVQSASPLCCKYKGVMHAFSTMCREEGGIRSVYLSNNNLVPTVLYHTIRPLLASSVPIVIDRMLGITAADAPVLYGAAELAIRTLGLLVTLPLETIRKRLQCQVVRSTSTAAVIAPFHTTVAIRPVPYNGILDALYKIMKEEGTRIKKNDSKQFITSMELSSSDSDEDEDDFMIQTQRQQQQQSASAWGIRGLYKGFGMQMAANGMVFLFHVLNGIDEEDLNGLSY